jgi:ATP-dependent DNA helicase RecQ
VQAVTQLLRGQRHLLDPRKMWPGGAFGARGRIAPDELPAEGRALVFADAPEWRETVHELFAADRPAPTEVLDACVRLLVDWRGSWPARPDVVVDLPASGFPLMTASVADHLASTGRLGRASLPLPGVPSPPRDLRELSSADEAALWRDLVRADAIGPEVAGKVVLLVVDASSSLWPITVASALLRRAGAGVVLPLLLHRRP